MPDQLGNVEKQILTVFYGEQLTGEGLMGPNLLEMGVNSKNNRLHAAVACARHMRAR